MRDWFDDDIDDDEADHLRRGELQCEKCGEWWPASHLDTDSGDCITCEDRRSWEDDDEV